jgi:hypothetical protein
MRPDREILADFVRCLKYTIKRSEITPGGIDPDPIHAQSGTIAGKRSLSSGYCYNVIAVDCLAICGGAMKRNLF